MNGFTTGRLFEPRTKSLNDKVHHESQVVLGEKYDTWMGIINKGDKWVYASSGDDLDFENWYPGKPSGTDCNLLSVSLNGSWFDYDCNYKFYFICEFV